LITTGVVVVAGVAAWQVYAAVSTTYPKQVGRAVVRQSADERVLSNPVQISIPSAGTASLTSCAESAHSTDPVRGLLEIPKLGVTAPVEQGSGDAQLDVAVGHDPYSVWPGATGNSVLAAHDVGYFERLPKLSTGDTILYVAPCSTYAFSVSRHGIVSPGSPVYDTRAPTLTLITGWPTDTLRSTSERYLVTADEVSQSSTAGASRQYLTTSLPPSVPVPSALTAQGVTLATYQLPIGIFSLTGSPDETWSQTTNPLTAEKPAVEDYIAGVRSLTQKHLDWWSDVAPGLPPPAPLIGARNPTYTSALDLIEFATGTRVDSLTLTNDVTVRGGKAPGRYSMTVGETIEGGTLLITHWSMQRL
jgi:LPXTG-site transpeptidase (sortase) family protein